MEAKKQQVSFRGLESYRLTRVQVSDHIIGHGAYANVLELEYVGLRCAGKKIHDMLLKQGSNTYPVRRFEEECSLLSQVRHPNIVQFLGICFPEDSPAPILVLEFLPLNLTSCIEQYGILSKEVSYSIFHDVAVGLCYLHSHIPPIIHRDLSSNNVLLASNMTAKISDLGVARILNLNPLETSRMTQAPGTPAYMPPEVMTADPIYNESVDEFSYGILMIHVLSGKWPEPQSGPVITQSGKLIPVSEAERREKFLQIIGKDHPLMELILKCLNNDPQLRAHADKLVQQLSEMKKKFPRKFANELEMLKQIAAYQEEKKTLLADVQQKEQQTMKQAYLELEKCKSDNERLRAQNALLSEMVASDDDLHSTVIQACQYAQEQRKQKLKDMKQSEHVKTKPETTSEESTVTMSPHSEDTDYYNIRDEFNTDNVQQSKEGTKLVSMAMLSLCIQYPFMNGRFWYHYKYVL